jgi:hypothetical protein
MQLQASDPIQRERRYGRMDEPGHISQTKRAELLSSVGAGVLGAGLALLLPTVLTSYAVAILLVGLVAHAWGMFQKHQLERQVEGVRLWWAEAVYWLCWLALAVLVLVIVGGQL